MAFAGHFGHSIEAKFSSSIHIFSGCTVGWTAKLRKENA